MNYWLEDLIVDCDYWERGERTKYIEGEGRREKREERREREREECDKEIYGGTEGERETREIEMEREEIVYNGNI